MSIGETRDESHEEGMVALGCGHVLDCRNDRVQPIERRR